jgi:hypothetical protein
MIGRDLLVIGWSCHYSLGTMLFTALRAAMGHQQPDGPEIQLPARSGGEVLQGAKSSSAKT